MTHATIPTHSTSIRSFFSWRINPYLLSLILLPIPVLFMHPSWIFSQFDHLDPWVYFGYFKDLKQHLKTFPGAYYGTRLPWILVGHVAYKIFTPLVAKYVLILLLYYTGLFSIYGILKKTIGLRTAFITALLLGCYKHFIISSSSEYIDGIAQAYFLLSLYFLTPGQNQRFAKRRFLYSGVFFSLLMFTQLFLTTYLPLIGCFYLYFHRPKRITAFLNDFSLFVVGYSLILFFLCLINFSLCHDFFFFKHIIIWTKNFIADVNPWWHPFSFWKALLNSYGVGMFTLISSCLLLIFPKVIPGGLPKKNVLFFPFLFIINAALFLFFQLVKKQPVLECQYYYTYLTPSLFLALGSLLSSTFERMSLKQFYSTLCIAGLLSFIALGSSAKITFFYEKHTTQSWVYFLILSTLLFSGLLLWRKRALFCLVPLLASLIFSKGEKKLNYLETIPFEVGKNIFLAINDATDTVKKMDRKGQSFFWYSTEEPYYRTIFISTCSAYLWGYRLINEHFPSTEGIPGYPFIDLSNKSFFLMSTDASAPEIAKQTLLMKGYQIDLIEQETVKRGDLKFNIFHFNTKKSENTLSHDYD